MGYFVLNAENSLYRLSSTMVVLIQKDLNKVVKVQSLETLDIEEIRVCDLLFLNKCGLNVINMTCEYDKDGDIFIYIKSKIDNSLSDEVMYMYNYRFGVVLSETGIDIMIANVFHMLSYSRCSTIDDFMLDSDIIMSVSGEVCMAGLYYVTKCNSYLLMIFKLEDVFVFELVVLVFDLDTGEYVGCYKLKTGSNNSNQLSVTINNPKNEDFKLSKLVFMQIGML